MSQTVSDILVLALEKIGVKQIFGLIGDSLNPLVDAVRRSSIEWVGVRHEEGAALAAAGQAKLTGRLGVCCGTTGPGSTHLVSGLYEAARDHAPVLAISGDMSRQLQGVEYFQTTNPNLLFRDVSLYTETISTAEQAPKVIHQAIASAYGGRGVAHLTIPQDIMGAAVTESIASLETLTPRTEFSASEADIAEMVQRMNRADKIVIMCGQGCHGLKDELCAISDKLKAPLIHSFKGKEIMAYDEPCWMGGIGMIGTKAVYKAVHHCDLLLMIGTDYPYSEFLPAQGSVIQIDERPEVLGRRIATDLGVVGSAKPTIKALLDKLKQKTNANFFNKVAEERQQWDDMLTKQADLGRSKDRIHPQAVARQVSDLAELNYVCQRKHEHDDVQATVFESPGSKDIMRQLMWESNLPRQSSLWAENIQIINADVNTINTFNPQANRVYRISPGYHFINVSALTSKPIDFKYFSTVFTKDQHSITNIVDYFNKGGKLSDPASNPEGLAEAFRYYKTYTPPLNPGHQDYWEKAFQWYWDNHREIHAAFHYDEAQYLAYMVIHHLYY